MVTLLSILISSLVLAEQPAPRTLVWAVENQDYDRVHNILASGVDPNLEGADGVPLLIRAFKSRFFSIAELLLDYGADPNAASANGTTVFEFLLFQEHLYQLTMQETRGFDATYPYAILIQAGAQPNRKLPSSGSLAAYLNRYRLPEFFQSAIAVDHPTKELLRAARRGHLEDLRAVVHEADLDHRDEIVQPWQGNTPLIYALEKGHVAMATLLLEQGADPNTTSRSGLSPLMATMPQFEPRVGLRMARILLDHGAHIDYQDPTGKTALILATTTWEYEMAGLLLHLGADPNLADNQGLSAQDYAENDLRLKPLFNQKVHGQKQN